VLPRAFREVWERITVSARALVGAPGARGAKHTVRLDDVRGRLEILLAALYDRSIQISTAKMEEHKSRIRWRIEGRPRHLRPNEVLSTTDGVTIELPERIEGANAGAAIAEYQFLAVEQAERLTRGTLAMTPASEGLLERDLYIIREGIAVDAAISRTAPGLRGAIGRAREVALTARPDLSKLTPLEREVEQLLRDSLSSPPQLEGDATPQASHEWAVAMAKRIRASTPPGAAGYRGIAPVTAWGSTSKWPIPEDVNPRPWSTQVPLLGVMNIGLGVTAFATSNPRAGKSVESEFGQAETKDEGKGRSDDASNNGDGDTDVPASEEAEVGEAAGSAQTSPTELVIDTEALLRAAGQQSARQISRLNKLLLGRPVDGGIAYPEWDSQQGAYRVAGSVVRQSDPEAHGGALYRETLLAHGPLVRRLRKEFEVLQARRVRLGRQRDGDEIDLNACVRALVDRRAGREIDDELYIDVRPARRGLAIALLVDISDSTDDWIAPRERVIDVAKVALILANEALDALGDLYTILTFSGVGRDDVRVQRVKDFTEGNGAEVRARISALQPDGYTRTGAAMRHATARLLRQPVKHRLLLMLSDGKPNDRDGYEGSTAVEDTRAAVLEARQRGVHPFCLTIDRKEQTYLRRIFGETGHTILQRPEQLPSALVQAVRLLLSR
jgi:nitric oxide reductase NorD protein